ncbi:hypothetical protein EE612_031248 [Oryza sativa]|uniref:Uncharacterized protein n=1 Tax=Oryza nivara TaxID=4536 RepID=A0A0E0HIR6_ORYNI|nr:hypothetical protein EE612_031248 [Oryza sativa]
MALVAQDIYTLEELKSIIGSGVAYRVRLHGVESLEEAITMYRTLDDAVQFRGWACPQLNKLALVAGIAAEVDRVIDELVPSLLEDDENRVLMLLLKNAAWSIRNNGKLVDADAGGIFRVRMHPIANRILKAVRLFLTARSTPTGRRDRLHAIVHDLKIFRESYYLPIP